MYSTISLRFTQIIRISNGLISIHLERPKCTIKRLEITAAQIDLITLVNKKSIEIS